MLLAAPYLAVSISTDLIADGGSGWFNALVLRSIGDAMKCIIRGPFSVSLLGVARVRERRTCAVLRSAHCRRGSVASRLSTLGSQAVGIIG